MAHIETLAARDLASVSFGETGTNVLSAWLASSLAWCREYVRRKRVMYELSRLNDRELADIRLTRPEISEIFKREFANRRTA